VEPPAAATPDILSSETADDRCEIRLAAIVSFHEVPRFPTQLRTGDFRAARCGWFRSYRVSKFEVALSPHGTVRVTETRVTRPTTRSIGSFG
jgi:hypothetical protein